MRKSLAILTTLLLLQPNPVSADLALGQAPPVLILEGDAGGRVGGGLWSSASLEGKVHVLMYVDPDKVKINRHVEEALAKEEFDRQLLASVAVINMAASWKPDFAIDLILKGKQEKYPNTIYVRDRDRAFVTKWGLVDQGYHVLALSANGEVIFSVANELSNKQVTNLIETIHKHISP